MSRGFRFRLEAALRQREREEQAAQRALFQAAQVHAHAQEEAARQRGALEHERRTGPAPGDAFEMERRIALLLHLDRAGRRLEQQEQVVQQHAREVERMRDQLRQASMRTHALERLRERQKAAYAREEERRMIQELDEHGALRFARLPLERDI